MSWRLHFFYFGSCAFAIAAALYGYFCPRLIKKHANATEFFEGEKYYFTNKRNFEYLTRLIIQLEKEANFIAREPPVGQAEQIDPTNLYDLAGVMGDYFVLQNSTFPIARKVIFVAYVVGFALIGIPAVITFFEVVRTAFAQVLRTGF